MTVQAAALRVPSPDDRAQQPLSLQTVGEAAAFIHARLSPLLVAEPSSDAERMASVLAFRTHAAVSRLETSLRNFHAVPGGIRDWTEVADTARMWADHPDYQEDFGRTVWEFPTPQPTHAILTIRRGNCSCSDRMGHIHREEVLPLEDLDKSPWNRLRLAGRLTPTGYYRRLASTGSLAEFYEVLPVPASRRAITRSTDTTLYNAT